MAYPVTRLRRLRKNPILRKMVTETILRREDMIMPLFVCHGSRVKNPIASMPGNFQMSVDQIVEECKSLVGAGINSVLLFGIPDHKDETGSVATHDDAIVQQAIKAIKKEIPDIFLIADICNCEYTTHGHCGTIVNGDVDNDLTLETLAAQALNAVAENLDVAGSLPAVEGANVVRNALKAAIEKAALGDMTVDEAWTEAVTVSNAALQGK